MEQLRSGRTRRSNDSNRLCCCFGSFRARRRVHPGKPANTRNPLCPLRRVMWSDALKQNCHFLLLRVATALRSCHLVNNDCYHKATAQLTVRPPLDARQSAQRRCRERGPDPRRSENECLRKTSRGLLRGRDQRKRWLSPETRPKGLRRRLPKHRRVLMDSSDAPVWGTG